MEESRKILFSFFFFFGFKVMLDISRKTFKLKKAIKVQASERNLHEIKKCDAVNSVPFSSQIAQPSLRHSVLLRLTSQDPFSVRGQPFCKVPWWVKALPVCSIQAAFVDYLLKISLSPLPSAVLDRLNTTEERALDVVSMIHHVPFLKIL